MWDSCKRIHGNFLFVYRILEAIILDVLIMKFEKKKSKFFVFPSHVLKVSYGIPAFNLWVGYELVMDSGCPISLGTFCFIEIEETSLFLLVLIIFY